MHRIVVIADLPPSTQAQVQRIIRYEGMRRTEVGLALIMTLTGFALLAPGDTFSLPIYDFIRAYMPVDHAAGGLAVVTGGMRLWALYINGRGRRTPLFRCAGSAMGFLFWASVSLGVVFSTTGGDLPIGLGLAMFPVFAIAEMQAMSAGGAAIAILDSLGTRERRRRDGRHRTA